MRTFAGDALEGVGADALERAHALARAVTEAVAYRSGTTGPGTSAAEALEQGCGVCQDQAHVLISAALTQEIPARYVAGYLFTGDDDDVMGQASHAWAELHVAGLGWVGFDPANRRCPDDSYVRLGSGLDAVGAAPIRGVTEGAGEEDLVVSVEVTRAQQQQ
jgi:transglutaminase-like putative cysteine protease